VHFFAFPFSIPIGLQEEMNILGLGYHIVEVFGRHDGRWKCERVRLDEEWPPATLTFATVTSLTTTITTTMTSRIHKRSRESAGIPYDVQCAREGRYLLPKNYVSTNELGRDLQLTPLCEALNGRLHKDIFPALVTTTRDPDTTSSVFATGKLVHVGSKAPEDGLVTAHNFTWYLWERFGIYTEVINWKLCNSVYSVTLPNAMTERDMKDLRLKRKRREDIPRGFDMERLELELPTLPEMQGKEKADMNEVMRNGKKAKKQKTVTYDPALFPGLTAHVRLPSGTTGAFTLFVTGRGVLTGLRKPLTEEARMNEFFGDRFLDYEYTPS